MSSPDDAPIFVSMFRDIVLSRTEAEQRAAELDRLLRDVEALHEPDADGECPTCMAPAPCVTFEVLHQQLLFDSACAAVRDRDVIDLTVTDRPAGPPVPSLLDLLAAPSPAVDRAFEALIGLSKPA